MKFLSSLDNLLYYINMHIFKKGVNNMLIFGQGCSTP